MKRPIYSMILLTTASLTISGCDLWKKIFQSSGGVKDYKRFVWVPDDIAINRQAFSSNVDPKSLGFNFAANTLSQKEIIQVMKNEMNPVLLEMKKQFPTSQCKVEKMKSFELPESFSPLMAITDFGNKALDFKSDFKSNSELEKFLGILKGRETGETQTAKDLYSVSWLSRKEKTQKMQDDQLIQLGGNQNAIYGISVWYSIGVMEGNGMKIGSDGQVYVSVFEYHRSNKTFSYTQLVEIINPINEVNGSKLSDKIKNPMIHNRMDIHYDGKTQTAQKKNRSVGKDENNVVQEVLFESTLKFNDATVDLDYKHTATALNEPLEVKKGKYKLQSMKVNSSSVSCLEEIK